MEPTPPAADDTPMSSGQKRLVVSILVGFVILGAQVEIRSAFMHRRMTDLGCYLRAAWAIRAGADPYAVTCDNDWHYNYPPFLAVVIGPLADPPAGEVAVPALPYAASVAVWYAIGVVAMAFAIHLLALVVETGLSQPPRRFGYAWWAMRLGPLILALPAAGRTLGRGQVNTIVLALLAGWILGIVRGRRLTGGMCLAFAICIKVIPAFLLLHPFWRRDRRTLAGCALGVFVGLVGLPTVVCGPAAAIEHAQTFLTVTLAPGLGLGHDSTRAAELTNANTTDSQSPMTVLHNLTNPRSWLRPTQAQPWVKMTHWIIAGLLTAATVWMAGRRPVTPRGELVFAGGLCLVMAIISPVCHLHYFLFATPLLAALWPGPRTRRTNFALAAFVIVQALSLFPISEKTWYSMPIREFGFTTVTALGLWAAALRLPSATRFQCESTDTPHSITKAA